MSPSSLFNSDFAPYETNEDSPINVNACPECKCLLTTQYTSTPLRYTVIYGDDDQDYPATGDMMGCMKCRLQWYNLSMPSHHSKLETPDNGSTYIVKAIGLPRYKWVKAWSRVDNPTSITFYEPTNDYEETTKAIVAYDDRNNSQSCNSQSRSWFAPIKRFFGFLGRIFKSWFS
jgi:hypothetical protein